MVCGATAGLRPALADAIGMQHALAHLERESTQDHRAASLGLREERVRVGKVLV